MNTQLEGSRLLLYAPKNGVLVPMCGSLSCAISIQAEELIATPPEDSTWKSVYYGEMSYTVSASGMCFINPDKFTHRDLIRMQITRQRLQWVCKNKDNDLDYLSGTVIIPQTGIQGDMDNAQMWNFSGTGSGPISDENPYEVVLLGNETNVIKGDGEAIIGYLKTGGNLPINDNC